jgi:hypothetical protein
MDTQKNQQKNQSEIAQFLEQWDQEVEAIQQGLHGLAITARHDFINRRMQALGGEEMIKSMNLDVEKTGQNKASSDTSQ